MIDPWHYIGPIFATSIDASPEINIQNITVDGMKAMLTYVLNNSRELHVKCVDFYENEITAKAVPQIVDGVTTGDFIAQLYMDLLVDYIRIPGIGFFSDEPGYFIVDYPMGTHWTPLKLVALFEFFRMVKSWDNGVVITLSKRFFEEKWLRAFDQVLQEYLSEKR